MRTLLVVTSATSEGVQRKDRARNRQALIDAAQIVFAESGIEAPLEQIARRAGLGSATLYRHFPERADLLEATLLRNLDRHAQFLEEAARQETGWKALAHYLAALFREQVSNVGYTAGMRAIPEGKSEQVDEKRRANLQAFARIAQSAHEEGSLRRDRTLSDLLIILFVNEQFVTRPKPLAMQASERFLDIALAGLSTVPAPWTRSHADTEIGAALAGLDPRIPLR